MKKKVLMILLVAVSIIGITKNVYAEEAYYTTPNGIELTREEYAFLTSFYSERYPDIMTQEMYDEFVEDDLIHSEVETVTYKMPGLALLNPGISPNSQTHTSIAKTLHISRGCLSTYCIITLNNTWTESPTIRSWDNIGVYLDDVNLISHNHTYVDSTAGTVFYTNLITEPDGVGNSVKLPDTGENIIISMAVKVGRGGTVYGSYQHAMQNTTLLNSQNYNIDIGGYGAVFNYTGNAIGVYDGMGGVDIGV